jgi:tetratricopeptide (TPR) repeat protein
MDSGREPAHRSVPAILVGLAALALQTVALRRVLVWDDVYLFARDDLYVNPARLVEALTSPLGKETPYWRPLATTSFLIESLVHGGVAEGFRLTAAVLHAIASALAFVLLDRLAGRRSVAVVAALVFACHPVHAETVTWISARFDLLAGVFALTALLAAGDGVVGRGRLAAVSAACAAAVLSKEGALVLPAVALLWAAAESRPEPGRGAASLRARTGLVVASGLGIAVALFLRVEAIGWTSPADGAAFGGIVARVTAVGRAFATSLQCLVWPWGSVAPVHDAPRSVGGIDLYGWFGASLLVLAAFVVTAACRRRPRQGLLAAAFLASLVPTLQFVPVGFAGGADTADRFLYLPAFLLVALLADVAAGDLAAGLLRPRRLLLGGGALVVALASYRVWVTTRWNDPVALWEWAQDRAPRSAYVKSQLARAHLAAGNAAAAEAAARGAVEDEPLLLAEILSERGRPEEATAVLDAALTRRPGDTQSRLLRAELRFRAGEVDGALSDFLGVAEAEARTPRYRPLRPAALAGAAQAWAAQSKPVAAEEALRRAEAEASQADERAWIEIARAWFALERVDAGLAATARARAAGAPEDVVLRAEIEGLGGPARRDDRIARLRRLDAIRPHDANVLDRLGTELWEAGESAAAEESFRSALEDDPGHGWARYHLALLLEGTGRADEGRTERERARADAKARGDRELLRRLGAAVGEERPRPGR